MAVSIRLVRLGRRNCAFFRLRVSDSRFAPGGRFIEELGFLNPLEPDPLKAVGLKKERIEHWLSFGAKLSPTVKSLFKKHGVGGKAKA